MCHVVLGMRHLDGNSVGGAIFCSSRSSHSRFRRFRIEPTMTLSLCRKNHTRDPSLEQTQRLTNESASH
jgi:hypothetical protein